ncbi:6-phosphogluconate dehydrogenase (decarboxylating) [Micromonospora sp. Llam0]|nr:6-phosphogluconate dehydrogenase (decarboxylating) [Micromonospora sp. Llam0]
MQLGFVGLGKMGANMVQRLRAGGHEVIGYDIDPELSDVGSLDELVSALAPPRHIWLMLPLGPPIEQTIDKLAGVLDVGDLIVEGGNSRWTDDGPRARRLAERGIGYLDCGVSGGIWGLDNGYALMVGGPAEQVRRMRPAFDTLKPPGDGGFVHAGAVGSGHFAKMVHNGIEYGLMQSYAEGFELLRASDLVTDVPGVLDSWTNGTVIRSWLLDLAVRALRDDAALSQIKGYAEDSGEGRWTVEAAVDLAVPVPAISAALYARFASRQDDQPAMKLVAALRREFGGHSVTDAGGDDAGSADEPAPGVTDAPRHQPGSAPTDQPDVTVADRR